MNKELIGHISGFLVFSSIIPYGIRVFQRKITPNIVTWFIWSIVGIAILLNYKGSGAKNNVWPAVFGCINPVIITVIAIFRGKVAPITKFDILCLILGLVSIVLWLILKSNQETLQYALYIGMIGDLCAGIPTWNFVKKHPDEDRPLMWILYGVGYGLSVFAITDHTFSNYILPIYMSIMVVIVAIPLIKFRIFNEIPLSEWW